MVRDRDWVWDLDLQTPNESADHGYAAAGRGCRCIGGSIGVEVAERPQHVTFHRGNKDTVAVHHAGRGGAADALIARDDASQVERISAADGCLLYTSDAADD